MPIEFEITLRMFQVHAADGLMKSGVEIKIFYSLGEARQWLRDGLE